jgi:hypothetical protein
LPLPIGSFRNTAGLKSIKVQRENRRKVKREGDEGATEIIPCWISTGVSQKLITIKCLNIDVIRTNYSYLVLSFIL